MPNGIGPKMKVQINADLGGVKVPVSVGDAYELTFDSGTHTIVFHKTEDIHRIVLDITHPSLITALEHNAINTITIDFSNTQEESVI